MPRSPYTTKRRARFIKLARAMLLQLGAEPRPLRFYEREVDGPAVDQAELVLDTPAGTLTLTPYDTWIAAIFSDPRHARRFVDCNPYSGKWNFHLWSRGEPDPAIDASRQAIESSVGPPRPVGSARPLCFDFAE